MNEYAETVKREVRMEEAVQYYGLKFNRAGFSFCPFHSEKTPSFKIKNGKGHCFGGCGWHGDVIQFVMDFFKLDFIGAVRKLNDDFGLALPIDRKPTLREQQEAEKRRREMLAERAKADAEKQAYETQYNALWDEYARLDIQRRKYAPKSIDEEFHPLYVEATKRICDIENKIDLLPLSH